jgi:hypothetical protein
MKIRDIVHNRSSGTAPPDAVYVGRGSPFGNPFILGKDGNRDEVCDKFTTHIASRPKLIKLVKEKLKGKHLVCFCAPARCHAITLAKIANV